MNKRGRDLRHHGLALLMACTGLATMAQSAAIAAGDDSMLFVGEDTRVEEAPSPVAVFVPITDDGRGDELLPTRQLIIAFPAEEGRMLHLDILDDRGRCVRTQDLTKERGRAAIPVDVEGLRAGRYVARVSTGAQAKVVRFRRDR